MRRLILFLVVLFFAGGAEADWSAGTPTSAVNGAVSTVYTLNITSASSDPSLLNTGSCPANLTFTTSNNDASILVFGCDNASDTIQKCKQLKVGGAEPTHAVTVASNASVDTGNYTLLHIFQNPGVGNTATATLTTICSGNAVNTGGNVTNSLGALASGKAVIGNGNGDVKTAEAPPAKAYSGTGSPNGGTTTCSGASSWGSIASPGVGDVATQTDSCVAKKQWIFDGTTWQPQIQVSTGTGSPSGAAACSTVNDQYLQTGVTAPMPPTRAWVCLLAGASGTATWMPVSTQVFYQAAYAGLAGTTTAGIQEAINAASASTTGGTVQLLCGKSTITSTITLANNVVVTGCGNGSYFGGGVTNAGTTVEWNGANSASGAVFSGVNLAGAILERMLIAQNVAWDGTHCVAYGVHINTTNGNLSSKNILRDMTFDGSRSATGCGGTVFTAVLFDGVSQNDITLMQNIGAADEDYCVTVNGTQSQLIQGLDWNCSGVRHSGYFVRGGQLQLKTSFVSTCDATGADAQCTAPVAGIELISSATDGGYITSMFDSMNFEIGTHETGSRALYAHATDNLTLDYYAVAMYSPNFLAHSNNLVMVEWDQGGPLTLVAPTFNVDTPGWKQTIKANTPSIQAGGGFSQLRITDKVTIIGKIDQKKSVVYSIGDGNAIDEPTDFAGARGEFEACRYGAKGGGFDPTTKKYQFTCGNYNWSGEMGFGSTPTNYALATSQGATTAADVSGPVNGTVGSAANNNGNSEEITCTGNGTGTSLRTSAGVNVNLNKIGASTVATGGSTTTVQKTAAGWGVNAFADMYVKIVSGVNGTTNQIRRIVSNTAIQLTIEAGFPFSGAIANNDTFEIYDGLGSACHFNGELVRINAMADIELAVDNTVYNGGRVLLPIFKGHKAGIYVDRGCGRLSDGTRNACPVLRGDVGAERIVYSSGTGGAGTAVTINELGDHEQRKIQTWGGIDIIGEGPDRTGEDQGGQRVGTYLVADVGRKDTGDGFGGSRTGTDPNNDANSQLYSGSSPAASVSVAQWLVSSGLDGTKNGCKATTIGSNETCNVAISQTPYVSQTRWDAVGSIYATYQNGWNSTICLDNQKSTTGTCTDDVNVACAQDSDCAPFTHQTCKGFVDQLANQACAGTSCTNAQINSPQYLGFIIPNCNSDGSACGGTLYSSGYYSKLAAIPNTPCGASNLGGTVDTGPWPGGVFYAMFQSEQTNPALGATQVFVLDWKRFGQAGNIRNLSIEPNDYIGRKVTAFGGRTSTCTPAVGSASSAADEAACDMLELTSNNGGVSGGFHNVAVWHGQTNTNSVVDGSVFGFEGVYEDSLVSSIARGSGSDESGWNFRRNVWDSNNPGGSIPLILYGFSNGGSTDGDMVINTNATNLFFSNGGGYGTAFRNLTLQNNRTTGPAIFVDKGKDVSFDHIEFLGHQGQLIQVSTNDVQKVLGPTFFRNIGGHGIFVSGSVTLISVDAQGAETSPIGRMNAADGFEGILFDNINLSTTNVNACFLTIENKSVATNPASLSANHIWFTNNSYMHFVGGATTLPFCQADMSAAFDASTVGGNAAHVCTGAGVPYSCCTAANTGATCTVNMFQLGNATGSGQLKITPRISNTQFEGHLYPNSINQGELAANFPLVGGANFGPPVIGAVMDQLDAVTSGTCGAATSLGTGCTGAGTPWGCCSAAATGTCGAPTAGGSNKATCRFTANGTWATF